MNILLYCSSFLLIIYGCIIWNLYVIYVGSYWGIISKKSYATKEHLRKIQFPVLHRILSRKICFLSLTKVRYRLLLFLLLLCYALINFLTKQKCVNCVSNVNWFLSCLLHTGSFDPPSTMLILFSLLCLLFPHSFSCFWLLNIFMFISVNYKPVICL